MPRPSRLLLLIVSFAMFGLGPAGLARAWKAAVPDVSGIWDLQGTFEARCDFPGFQNEPPEPIAFRLLFTQSGSTLSGGFDVGGAPPGADLPPIAVVGTVGEAGEINLRVLVDSQPSYILTGRADGSQLTLRLAAEVPPGVPCTAGGPLTGVLRQAGTAPTPLPPLPSGITPIPPPDPRIQAQEVRIFSTASLLPSGRTVARELMDAVDQLVGAPGSRFTQDNVTGAATLTLATGQKFGLLPVALTLSSPLTRQQATPPGQTDPVSGLTTITTASGARVMVMGAPPNLTEFVGLTASRGVTGVTILPGQFLLATGSTSLQFSTRLSFEVTGGGGAPGITLNADGTVTLTYATGERQQVFPLFADVTGFLATARAFPGVAQATAALDGTVTVTAGAQAVRLRPDFSVRASPAGSKRILLDDPGGPSFDLGDGRRQRFTIAP